MKLTPVLLLCAALALAACKNNDTPPAHDRGLRALLGIRTLTASHTIPPDVFGFKITVLGFKNGKLVCEGHSYFATKETPVKKHLVELSWNPETGDSVLLTPFMVSKHAFDADFIKQAGFNHFVQHPAFNHFGPQTYADHQILAYASGNQNHAGERIDSHIGPFENILKTQKHVLALALKTYKTEQEFATANDKLPLEK